MASVTKLTTPFLGENGDLLLKLASIILGTFYVLGLLISNVQLMELGVADFSSLQVRNVMTGFLFLVYLLMLLVTLTPLWAAMYAAWSIKGWTTRMHIKVLLSIGVAIVSVIAGVVIASFFGTILGYLYPWGRRWDEVALLGRTTWTWTFMKADFLRTIGQFRDSYFYPKTIVASVTILFSLPVNILVALGLIRASGAAAKLDKSTIHQIFRLKYTTTAILSYWLAASMLLLVGFADEVYPNIKYNLGGGQPQIAELQISEEKEVVTGLPGISVCCGTSKEDPLLRTEPVAIWYQSDKFLYASPLLSADQGTSKMVAIDIKLIRTIRYLPKYVRIKAGGLITSVGSY